MRNWIKYLIVTIIVALLTNGGQFYLWNQYIDKVKVDYENEINNLSTTIEDLGPLVNVYSVQTETIPGRVVKQEDLTIVQSPVSLINDSFVQEPQEIVGKYYKINIKPGTPLTADLFMDQALDDSTREMDLVADTWSVGLEVGDYVDYEITYPYGEKYTVLSHIRVEAVNQDTIKTHLNSVQRHIYNGALVDYFLQRTNGATINMVKYPEPGIQKPSKVSYSVPANILSVITEDPNVIKKINGVLNSENRALIENGLNSITDLDASNLSSGRSKISNQINGAEKEYLQIIEKQMEEAEQEAALHVGEGVVE